MSISGTELESQIWVQSPGISSLGSITLAGTIRNSPGLKRRALRVLGAYAVVLVFEGGGTYRDANGLRSTVTAGDLLILFPELGHWYGPSGNGRWSETYAIFQGPVFDLLRTAGILQPAKPILRVSSTAIADRQLRSIFEVACEERGGQNRACAQLAAWLTDMLGDAASPPRTEPALLKVRGLLDNNLETEPEWDHLAKLCGWSYETLRKRFTEAYGMSPARYRFERRIEAAKSLLSDTRLANKEIAATLGFADEFHFSKRFKQAAGISPREFRKAGTERRREIG